MENRSAGASANAPIFWKIRKALTEEFEKFCGYAEHDRTSEEEILHPKKKKSVGIEYSFFKNGVKYSFFYSYTEKNSVFMQSLLYFRIMPENHPPLCILLEELLSYVCAEDFRCCCFPYLKAPEEARLAFRTLASVYLRNQAEIEQILENKEKFSEFLRWQQEEMQRCMGMSAYFPLPEELQEDGREVVVNEGILNIWMQRWLLCRTEKFYQSFLAGNYEDSVKRCEGQSEKKKNRRTTYEQQLLEFEKGLLQKGERFDALDGAVLPDFKAVNAVMMGGSAGKFHLLFLPALLLSFAFCAGICVALHLGIGQLFYGDALYTTALEKGSILFQLTPGLLASIGLAGLLTPLLYRKLHPRVIAAEKSYEAILMPKKAKKKTKLLLSALFLALVFLLVLMPVSSGVSFYDDHLTVSSPVFFGPFPEDGSAGMKAGFIKIVTIDYDEIEALVEKPDRINSFDELLEFPSYLLRLRSGEEFDLYEYGDYDSYRQVLRRLFEEKQIPFVQGQSEKAF